MSESYKMWLKKHPNAVLNCTECGGHLGSELVKNGITHHISNCQGKHKPNKNNFAVHSAEAYPHTFAFRKN